MIDCPACGRLYPEVAGAPTQVCPHCGHEVSAGGAPAPGQVRLHADPVGAVQQAWRLARKHYLTLLLLWLPALALELAVAFGTGAYERAQGFPSDPNAMTTGEQMRWLGVVLPLSLATSAVRLALWAFVAAFALDRIVGGARLAQWRRLLGVSLAAGLVLTLTFVAGFFLLVVGFFVVLHWFLYVPAYLADGVRGIGAAFEASRRFARQRLTHGFTALVVLIGGGLLAAEFAASLAPGALGLVAPALVGWIGGPIVPLLAASYVGVAMLAPARPAASGTDVTRAVTKCPRCATLIPYAPGDGRSASELVCPSCGYAGRPL